MSNRAISNSNPEGLSKDFLNEHYSNEEIGFMIICEPASTIYLKTENSWVSVPIGTII